MSDANQLFGQALVKSLVGERGHIRVARALPDIDVELAGKKNAEMPYSIYQLLKHMIYWQQFMLEHLEGRKPQLPGDVMESWPQETGPQSEEAWQAVINEFLEGVDRAVQIAETAQLDESLAHFPGETKAGLLRNIASHNSYHLGEIVLLRRIYGTWPPPGGGLPA
ncbi:DinB family protein [Paenibacillus sp. CMAA1739]|uniref:DinB family protein n=1 Tax=Paenibacillus ottowii TaxID=2315729 RepID=UPI0027302178|nr:MULTISPECIES: DinB family protein [Paenibacillus]MDP1512214.1 DinB family protein [Paenibacillus ottowii]MEC4567682.1 DinB family protein [Paenibacillus sp. CMAA1739]